MAALAGKDGLVKIGTNTVALMDSWEVNPSADMLDITSFGDDWKTKIAGLKDWSAKVSGNFDYTDTDGQVALVTAFINGTTVTLKLYTDDTHYVTGSAFVTSFPIKVGVSDKETVEFDLDGTGALDVSNLGS